MQKRAQYFRGVVASIVAAAVSISSVVPATAQGLPLIRDTEIENLLADYAKPLFQAAGLGSGRITMRIVRSDSFNAFVLDGRNVFVHTGALQQSDTPNQIIGVIAHETGHITGGHMAALRTRIARDQTKALLMQLLGIGLMVAGGVSKDQSFGAAGQGVLYGGNEVVMRSLLSERRSQESAADQAGIKFLNATRQSGRGMLETFERFAQQEYIGAASQDVFYRSHPVATDRLSRLRQLVERSPFYNQKDNPDLQLRHDMVRAKLSGYLDRPQVVFNRYPVTDKSLPARYARAIARFFQGGAGAMEASVAEMDALIREQPGNGYFYEVKGDLLMRGGRIAEAIPALRHSLKLLGDSPLVRVQLATALQSGDNPASAAVSESVSLLRKSLVEDQNPDGYRLLANAFYKQGKGPEADAMMAQAHYYGGNIKEAQIFAKRAARHLKSGTPEWIKNDDIINYKPPQT